MGIKIQLSCVSPASMMSQLGRTMVGTFVSQQTLFCLDIRQFLFKSELPVETAAYGLLFFSFAVLSVNKKTLCICVVCFCEGGGL